MIFNCADTKKMSVSKENLLYSSALSSTQVQPFLYYRIAQNSIMHITVLERSIFVDRLHTGPSGRTERYLVGEFDRVAGPDQEFYSLLTPAEVDELDASRWQWRTKTDHLAGLNAVLQGSEMLLQMARAIKPAGMEVVAYLDVDAFRELVAAHRNLGRALVSYQVRAAAGLSRSDYLGPLFESAGVASGEGKVDLLLP